MYSGKYILIISFHKSFIVMTNSLDTMYFFGINFKYAMKLLLLFKKKTNLLLWRCHYRWFEAPSCDMNLLLHYTGLNRKSGTFFLKYTTARKHSAIRLHVVKV